MGSVAPPSVQKELSFATLYDGKPRVRKKADYLDDLGFELDDVIPSFRHPQTDQLLQADGIFPKRRRSHI